MPFRERALVELVNESNEPHTQYFYVDYETFDDLPTDAGFFHADFRRANPFGGWGPEIAANKSGAHLSNIVNKERMAWEDNYVILETKGKGHYIGCNLSVTNFRGDWWGEGDDMIWVDGYKWPPDLHGTGSEDYLNQAWGMQDNAFLRNGSSIFEGQTSMVPSSSPWSEGAYQTSYVFHIENPVRFQKSIKVTIEHGHANHLANEMSSVAYWYADQPARAVVPPPVQKRMPVLRDNLGRWLFDKKNQVSRQTDQIEPGNEENESALGKGVWLWQMTQANNACIMASMAFPALAVRYIRKEIPLLPQEQHYIYRIPFTLNLEADYLDSIRDLATIYVIYEDYRVGASIDYLLDEANQGQRSISTFSQSILFRFMASAAPTIPASFRN